VISLRKNDCLGAAAAAFGAGATVLVAAGLLLRRNEISFFQTDFGSSPGAAGTVSAFDFDFRRKEISFFQIDCSSIV
jgi:hypothetical protein